MQINEFVSRLEGAKGGGRSYTARCPAHDDTHNSLSINQADDGRILLNCHAGCNFHDIIHAIGIPARELAPPKEEMERPQIVARYTYHDAEGKPSFQKVKFSDKSYRISHHDGSRWRYGLGGHEAVLYNLPAVLKADTVWICEGEKDADNLIKCGVVATSAPHGAGPGKWKENHTVSLSGKNVIICQDNDPVGKEYAAEVTGALLGTAKSVKLLDVTKIDPDLPLHGDVSDVLAKVGFEPIEELAKRTGEYTPAIVVSESDWLEIVPFGEVKEPPAFPLQNLPPAFRAMSEAIAESMQVDPAMPGIIALGLLATIFQGRYQVQVKEGHVEPLSLYCVAVAQPAERKSPVVRVLTAPLYAYETQRYEAEKAEIAFQKTEREMLEKERFTAIKQGDKVAARSLDIQLNDMEDMEPFRMLADDCTPEMLSDLMDRHNETMSVISAEGGIFDILNGRYSRIPNLDLFLKAYDGDPFRQDRKGSHSNILNNPHLSVVLAVQPTVLENVFGNSLFMGRGLCGRFLYVLCKSNMGHRKTNTDPIPTALIEGYSEYITRMLEDDSEGVLTFSDEAREAVAVYDAVVEERLGKEWFEMQSWAGKAFGRACRIAALLHCAEYPASEPISLETFNRAAEISECLAVHAETIFLDIGGSPTVNEARYLLKHLLSTGKHDMSKRELIRKCHGKLAAADMERGLEELESRGYIRRERIHRGGVGRPAETIIINPCLTFQ